MGLIHLSGCSFWSPSLCRPFPPTQRLTWLPWLPLSLYLPAPRSTPGPKRRGGHPGGARRSVVWMPEGPRIGEWVTELNNSRLEFHREDVEWALDGVKDVLFDNPSIFELCKNTVNNDWPCHVPGTFLWRTWSETPHCLFLHDEHHNNNKTAWFHWSHLASI